MRPATALVISNHAAFAGGVLMIFTKNKNYGKHVDLDLHLKTISPLGYQIFRKYNIPVESAAAQAFCFEGTNVFSPKLPEKKHKGFLVLTSEI